MPRGIGILREQLLGHPVRLIFTLSFFVLHNAPLQIERLLVQRAQQVPHAIGLHPQRKVDRGCGDILEIIRAIGIGGAI